MLLPGEISRTTSWFRRSQQRPVCHEQSIVKYFGALRMMREGPSEPAFQAKVPNHLYAALSKRHGSER